MMSLLNVSSRRSPGGCVISENDVSATADWDPLDPRDDLVSPSETLDPGHELEDCSHTIQKFHAIQNDVSPGILQPERHH